MKFEITDKSIRNLFGLFLGLGAASYGCMFATYYWGRHLTAKDAFSFMMDWLEEQKFVKIEIDENGEKYFVKLDD